MKKMFTLFVAVALLTAVQAQKGSGNKRGNGQNDQRKNQQNDQWDNQNGYGNDNNVKNYPNDNDDRFNNSNSGFERNKGMRIAQINREYQYKIQKVKNSYFMSRGEKKRQIRFLEDQRLQEIRMVNFNSNKNRKGDRYDHNDRNDHSNRRY
jgi:hypothetical protein